MATQFAVDLVFKAQGGGKLRDLSNKLQGLEGTAKKGQKSLEGVGRSASRAGNQAGKAAGGVSKLSRAIGGLVSTYAAIQAAKFVFFKTAELETQTRSLQVLTGSLKEAQGVISELQSFAAVTPFTSTELVETAKRLKAFGVDTEKLVETTKRLGDVAGATGAELSGVATAYGQIQAKGRLQGEELLQLQERGINLQDELQKMYGLTGDEFRKALEKGRFSAEAVELALRNVTEAGGKYANGAIAQSDTLNGRLSTLQDNIGRLAQNIGRQLAPVFEWVINKSIETINYINRLFNQANKIQGYGVDNKTRDRLFSQATQEAKKIALLRGGGGGKLDPAVFNQVKQERFSDLLENYGINKGVVEVEIKPVIDKSGPKIPELLGLDSNKEGGGGTGGAGRLKEQTTQQLKATQGLVFQEGNRLKIAQAADGAQKMITESLVRQLEIQQQYGEKIAEAQSAGEIANLQEAEKLALQTNALTLQTQMTEKVKEMQRPLDDIIASNTIWLADNARIKELVAEGITPALAEAYVEIEKAVAKENEFYTLQLGILEGELARVDANSEIAKKIQEQIDKMRELQGLLPKKEDEAKGGAKEKDGKGATGKIEDYMNKLKAELMDTEGMIVSLAQTVESELGSAMSNAITGLIDGTMTAEQAFSQMFKNIGKAFIDMATQMIAKAIVLKILGIAFGGGTSGGGGGSWGGSGGDAWGGFAGALHIPKLYAVGGYVTGPTNALIG